MPENPDAVGAELEAGVTLDSYQIELKAPSTRLSHWRTRELGAGVAAGVNRRCA